MQECQEFAAKQRARTVQDDNQRGATVNWGN